MKKTVISIICIVLVIMGLLAAMKARAPKKPQATTGEIWASQGIPVSTCAAIRGDIEQTVEVTGDINALSKATLSAKIPGRVAQVYVREGDRVSAGTVIAMLDQADALSNVKQAQAGLEASRIRLSQAVTNAKVTKIQTDSQIEQAKATLESANARLAVVKKPARNQEQLVAANNVESAKADFENAEANYRRNQQLLKDGAISASAFDLTKSQYKMAEARLKSAKDQLSLIKEGGRDEDIAAAKSQVDSAKEGLRAARANAAQNLLKAEDIKSAAASLRQAEAALALAQEQLSYTVIKSPISGEIASRTAESGQVVSPGVPIAEVVNLGSIYFKGDISEKQLANVHKGQRVNVKIDALSGRSVQGVVEEIYPAGSTISRNFPVRIKIIERDQIRPGMFARGDIITGMDKNVLLVPKDAVEERKGTKIVFAVGAKNKVKRYDVEVIRENRDYMELMTPAGFDAGETLVTEGRQNLQDGSIIAIKK